MIIALTPEQNGMKKIAHHIEKCYGFIAFISKNYISSEDCKDELSYARDIQKNRLLVYLEDIKLPSGMAMRSNRLQAIHKYTYDDSQQFISKLLETPMLTGSRLTDVKNNGNLNISEGINSDNSPYTDNYDDEYDEYELYEEYEIHGESNKPVQKHLHPLIIRIRSFIHDNQTYFNRLSKFFNHLLMSLSDIVESLLLLSFSLLILSSTIIPFGYFITDIISGRINSINNTVRIIYLITVLGLPIIPLLIATLVCVFQNTFTDLCYYFVNMMCRILRFDTAIVLISLLLENKTQIEIINRLTGTINRGYVWIIQNLKLVPLFRIIERPYDSLKTQLNISASWFDDSVCLIALFFIYTIIIAFLKKNHVQNN